MREGGGKERGTPSVSGIGVAIGPHAWLTACGAAFNQEGGGVMNLAKCGKNPPPPSPIAWEFRPNAKSAPAHRAAPGECAAVCRKKCLFMAITVAFRSLSGPDIGPFDVAN